MLSNLGKRDRPEAGAGSPLLHPGRLGAPSQGKGWPHCRVHPVSNRLQGPSGECGARVKSPDSSYLASNPDCHLLATCPRQVIKPVSLLFHL